MRAHVTMRLSGLAGAALVALAACTPEPEFIPRSSYETGPSQIAFAMHFRQGQSDLEGVEIARIRGLLRDLELRAGDDIAVRIGVTGRDAVDNARVAAAAAAVTGTPARVRVMGTDPAPLGSDRVDVGVIEVVRNGRLRVVCQTPAIDSWERDRLLVDPPVACANALNIANMAANPRDLVAPRPMTGSHAATTIRAVERYRTDQVKQPARVIGGTGG